MRTNLFWAKQTKGQAGQAAVESVFSILFVLLLMLASCQILYTSLVATEAMKRAHKASLDFFREMNAKGHELETAVEELQGKIEVKPGESYATVVTGWSLYHKDAQPPMQAHAEYSGGKMYKAIRGIMIGAGPLKGEGGVVDTIGEGRSAFGVTIYPLSDGQGYNISGQAIRHDAFQYLCDELGIENLYFH